MTEAAKQILSGIRVLDCTVAMAGPFAAQRLGDLGADVIKVEPVEGEWQRRMAAGGGEGRKINASFLSLNRNKRSLAINLKSQEGREAIQRVAKTADVFLQNYRPHVASKLGVDYETLSAINPKLIYVSISGYGTDGPYASRPGQDLVVQGLSGSMYSAGTRDGPPQPSGQYVVDATTAYCAFEGALAALFHRERTGEGQRVDINMLDAALSFQMQEISVYTIDGKPQERTDEPHGHVYIRAPYSPFPTQDGYVTIAFPAMAKLGELFNEPRLAAMDDTVDTFAKRDEIHRIVAEHTARWKRDELLDAMLKLDIWSGPVHDFQSVMDDPQVKHNGSFVQYQHHSEGPLTTPGFPIRFDKTPSKVARGAPLVGEHSREVLAAAGYSDAEISDLFAKELIGGS